MSCLRLLPRLLLLALVPVAAAALLWQLRSSQPPATDATDRSVVLDGRPHRILDGVYALGDLDQVALYLVEAADSLVLVDTGFRHTYAQLHDAVRALGLDPARIKHVLITHMHLDHCEASPLIRDETGARVYAGAADAEELERGAPWDAVLTGRLGPSGAGLPPMSIDRHLRGGEALDIPGLDLRALATPGHTRGSTCYLLRKEGLNVLFCGDVFMGEGHGAVGGVYPAALHPRFGGSAEAYLASIRSLEALDVDVLLPGHPYLDRTEGTRPARPFLPTGRWTAILANVREELQTILDRFDRDGRSFLDEEPRRLRAGLLYLGMLGPTAVYGLETGDGIVLLDPGPAESETQLWDRLASLGYGPESVRAILLTRQAPELCGSLPALVLGTKAPVYCGAEEAPLLGALGALQLLRGGESLEFGNLRVETLATPGYAAGAMTYLVVLTGKLAIFPGDTVTPTLPLVYRGPPALPQALARSLAALADRKADMWLPSNPWKYQNAYLYDGSWRETVEVNLGMVGR